MTEPPDLNSIRGSATRNVLAESLRNFRDNYLLLIEYHAIDAQIKRAKFLALIKEGFTEAQALELCK